MTPEALADLAALAFADSAHPWTERDFRDVLEGPGAILVTDVGGFALGRSVAGEAELLLIATEPEHRRKGIGRENLARFERAAHAQGARAAFVEVAQGNLGAQRLYTSAGYETAGRRRRYYERADGTREDALVLRKPLGGD